MGTGNLRKKRWIERVLSSRVAGAAAGLLALAAPTFATAAPGYDLQSTYVVDPAEREQGIALTARALRVAIDGNTAIVGVRQWGSAYILERDGDGWSEQARLANPSPPAPEEDDFGPIVALDGDTAVVATPAFDRTAPLAGRIDIFVRNGTTWTPQALLYPTRGEPQEHWDVLGDQLAGTAVAIDGDYMVFTASHPSGAFGETIPSVWTYERTAGSWRLVDYFRIEEAGANSDKYRTSLALQDDVMVIGVPAHGEDDRGAAYVYMAPSHTYQWSHVATLQAADPIADEQFGSDVAINGETLLVSTQNSTRALVFSRSGSTWTQTAALQHANSAAGRGGNILYDLEHAGDRRAVGISGDLAFVSDPVHGVATFQRTAATSWTAGATIRSTDPSGGRLIDGVAIHGSALIVSELDAPATQLGMFAFYTLANDVGMDEEEALYFSAAERSMLGALVIEDEDIARFEEATETYTLFFDGSDVGLAGHDVDAFARRADGSLLLSFDRDITLPGTGLVRPQDVVRFVPTSLGELTQGTFQPFFIGADHRLTAAEANVTGVFEATDGRLFLSFGAPLSLPNLNVYSEDIVQFNPQSNDYSMVFDGTDMALGPHSLDAFSFHEDGTLLLSLRHYPTSGGLPGLPGGVEHDAFMFVPSGFPEGYDASTSGSFRPYYVAAHNAASASVQIDGLYRHRVSQSPAVYQAEWGTLSGSNVVERVNEGYMGASYVNSAKTGGVLEFHVEAGWGGTRVLRFRNALGVPESRTGRLVVNGVARTARFISTGSWTSWTNTDFVAQLRPGTNTIRLETNGQDLANIDQLTVVTMYQAEDGSVGGGTLVETVNGGYSGSAYVNSSRTGGFLRFGAVDGGIGGTRMLRIRYALDDDNARSGRLVVNGIPQAITFRPTGSWSTWTTRDVPIPLAPGAINQIGFETSGSDLANIDQIEIH